MGTKVYFKPTDSNSYLPTLNGHHPMWLRNIPKGQMMRVRRNCSNGHDYRAQAAILKKKFMEKGYSVTNLDGIIEDLSQLSRTDCLKDVAPLRDINSLEWSFISGYHSQFREVEQIFLSHWHILLLNRTLKDFIPSRPKFIYRKALNYGDRIVKKVIDPPNKPPSFWDKDGFFACRKCRACREVSRPMRAV